MQLLCQEHSGTPDSRKMALYKEDHHRTALYPEALICLAGIHGRRQTKQVQYLATACI